MARKTIDIQTLTERANARLSATLHHRHIDQLNELSPEQAFRLGVASLLEWALHETGNYHGFNYVNPDGTFVSPYVAGETDETRRVYFQR